MNTPYGKYDDFSEPRKNTAKTELCFFFCYRAVVRLPDRTVDDSKINFEVGQITTFLTTCFNFVHSKKCYIHLLAENRKFHCHLLLEIVHM